MEENGCAYEREVDLGQLFLALLRNARTIILIGIIFAALLGGYKVISFKPESMYSATARVYIERDFSKNKLDELLINSENLILNDGIMTSEYYKNILTNSLKEDYKVIITSNTVLEEVKNNLNLDIDKNELYSRITIQNLGSSIVEINVKNKDEQLAKDIVDALAKVSSQRIKQVMEAERVEVIDEGFVTEDLTSEQLLQLAEGNNIEDVLPSQSTISILKYIIIGGMVGCFLAAGIVLFMVLLDKTMKDEKDIELYLGLPVISTVPIIKGTKNDVKKGRTKKSKRLSQYCK